MEKKKPHHLLALVKELAMNPATRRFTGTAIKGAAEFGLDNEGIVGVISNLNYSDFFKSMTTYADHTLWQDVYRPKFKETELYIKLTVEEINNGNLVAIISFKEK